jgi:enoyl-CoA hydratase
MWVFRIGAQAAKRMLFTGDLVGGKEAKELGICLKCVPDSELDAEVAKLAKRIEG